MKRFNHDAANPKPITVNHNKKTMSPITLNLNITITHQRTPAPQLETEPPDQSPTTGTSTNPDPAALVYTVDEVAALLKVTPKTVYRLIERGLLKSTGAVRHKRITPAEIERFLRVTMG